MKHIHWNIHKTYSYETYSREYPKSAYKSRHNSIKCHTQIHKYPKDREKKKHRDII